VTTAPTGATLTIGLLWFLVAGIVTYWTNVLMGGALGSSDAYLEFSAAFPPADFTMGPCAATAAETLRRRKPVCILWCLVTAGALAFIGIVDVTYNLQHGMYRSDMATAWEGFVNMYSLTFPVWLARFTWTRRRALGA
jgi:hypothetical protein